MPVTDRGGAAEYLKAQSPSWESLQTALSIFALFIIVRYCARRVYSWLRPAERLNHMHPTSNVLLQHRRYQPHPWPMDEKSRQGGNGQETRFGEGGTRMTTTAATTTTTMATNPMDAHKSLPGPFISRLPPAPPLTPPELSTAIFTLDESPRSRENFIHQSNPDYMSSTSGSSFEADSPDSSSFPRRRSYTRTFPIIVPVPRQAQPSEAESAGPTFSPSSYPPSGQLLPPAPPSGLELEDDAKAQRNVDVQGEIISVLDRDGAGWKRHTRVYGGGACLACAASGGRHSGGFYGATVTPEEMR